MGRFDKLREESIKLLKKNLKASIGPDQLISQTINSIEESDKAGNMLVTRLREWYALYNPEFEKWMFDQEKFSSLILRKDKETLLKEIKIKGKSIGADLNDEDINAMKIFAKKVDSLYGIREDLTNYIGSIMVKHCPNLLAVTGTLLGAKLIAKSGSLKRLAMKSASTIQVIGAEKALFRHLKTGAKPPRHGLLIQHKLISSAKQKDHGKRARAIADKISVAVKVDYFKGKFIGDKLIKDLYKKFDQEMPILKKNKTKKNNQKFNREYKNKTNSGLSDDGYKYSNKKTTRKGKKGLNRTSKRNQEQSNKRYSKRQRAAEAYENQFKQTTFKNKKLTSKPAKNFEESHTNYKKKNHIFKKFNKTSKRGKK